MTKRTPKPKRYVAVCGRCYTYVLVETNSKREAATACTSHMNVYKHDCWIRDRVEQPDKEMKVFDVYNGRKIIDTVFYSDRSIDVDEVKRSLVEHDGYDPSIRVVLRKEIKL